MNINQISDSKYLKKEDCGRGILCTISGYSQVNVAMENDSPEMKWTLNFSRIIGSNGQPMQPKPMILNKTNASLIADFLGSEEADPWIGQDIVLYNDPSIMFAGKRIGGIRARAPQNQPPPPQQQQAPQQQFQTPVQQQYAQQQQAQAYQGQPMNPANYIQQPAQPQFQPPPAGFVPQNAKPTEEDRPF